jgi:hypothetical protein
MRRLTLAVLSGVLGLGLWAGSAGSAHAQDYSMGRFFYYPYYYYPHNYWPTQGPRWPEPIGAKYAPPPAWMAYPPFKEPNWRYDWYEPHKYYRGFHFWLDQF